MRKYFVISLVFLVIALMFAPSDVCAAKKGYTFLGITWTNPPLLVSFDPFAGKWLQTSSINLGPFEGYRGLAYDGHHTLYAITGVSWQLFSINLSNGAVKKIATLDLGQFGNGHPSDIGGGLTYVPSTRSLYATFCSWTSSYPTDIFDQKEQLIQINPTNGQVAKVADLATGLVDGLIWEPESMTFLGWTIPGQYQPPSLFRFDPATGVTNIIFDPPYYAIGLARSTNPGKYIAWTSMNNQNYFVELDPVARTMVLLGESHHNEAIAMVLVPRDPLAKKKLTQ